MPAAGVSIRRYLVRSVITQIIPALTGDFINRGFFDIKRMRDLFSAYLAFAYAWLQLVPVFSALAAYAAIPFMLLVASLSAF